MDYGEVLSKAWKIIWKFKILWLFGLLASCGQGSSVNFNWNINGDRGGPSDSLPGPFLDFINNISPGEIIFFIVIVLLVVLLLTAAAIFFSTVGRAGLIRGAMLADGDENAHLTLGGLFSEGMRYFWRIFGLNLIVGLAGLFIFLIIVGIPLILAIAGSSAGNGAPEAVAGMILSFLGIFMFCFCCLILPILLVVSVLLELAYRAIIIEDRGIWDGLRRGWEVLKTNPGPVALIWLLLLILGWIAGVLISLPLLGAAAPLLLAFIGGRAAVMTSVLLFIVCCGIYLPVLLVLQGILHSYLHTAWTLAYLRLTGTRPAQPAEVFDTPTPQPA